MEIVKELDTLNLFIVSLAIFHLLIEWNIKFQFQANKSKSDRIRSIAHATGKHYLYVDFGQLAHLVFHILSDFGPGKGITLPPHYIKW